MKDVVIASACRTAIGAFGGSLKDSHAATIASVAMKAAVERSGIDPAMIDDVRFGCCMEPVDTLNVARIAALLAGAGIKTLLLDIVPPNLKAEEKKDPPARNRIVKAGLDAALAIQPALFMSPRDAERITIGNLEDDFAKIADCDWIVEVVVENLKIKQDLLKRIEPVRKKAPLFLPTPPVSR